MLSTAGLSSAQAPPSDSELIQQLLSRVNQLEQEIKDLRGKEATPPLVQHGEPTKPVATAQVAKSADAQSASQAADAAEDDPMEPAANPEAGSSHDHNHIPMPAGATFPYVHLRAFGDLGYTTAAESTGVQGFGIGGLDLFATAKIAPKLGVLAEASIEADGVTNAVGIDMERLLLQFHPSDYLNVDVGRYHQSIGYYNTAYHHGRWFQTTVGRPFIFSFEDEGGLLPIHNVGVSVSGRLPSGSLGLHYVFELGNGRAYRTAESEAVQYTHDENRGKSFNLAFFMRPQAWPGLELGGSVLRDRLTPLGQAAIRQYIFSGHAVYIKDRIEFLNEGILMRHTRESGVTGALTTSVPAFYSQFAYRVASSWRPYLRYEYENANAADPIARPVLGTGGWRQDLTMGVRYDLAEFLALKLQVERIERRNLPATYQFPINLAFTF